MYNKFDLEEIRSKNKEVIPQAPFEHQKDAWGMLSKVFDFKPNNHKSGILVLPTGAGKTFTSVNWICKNVVPKNYKVLWLANTGHLLKQAFEEFSKNILQIPDSRKSFNIRAVASSPAFSDANQIEVTDDVLIITTQTAINQYHPNAKNMKGEQIKTKFESFLEQSKSDGLFLVLDEAHHAPASGCRNLLIGGTKFEIGIKQLVPNSYFLGLTATPTYSDKSKRGWLWEIFSTDVEHIGKKIKKGIVYEAKIDDLQKAGILAIPVYHEKNTGGEIIDFDDKTYETLTREHKDLPNWLIEKLAKDEKRNNFIIKEYIQNKSLYGKTIIFADRWFQCVYLKEKLLENNISANAVFSHIDATPGSAEERNNRTTSENDEIIENFKKNKLDVIINVKMLTEGTDVPDVDTVFITRQTTSFISLTQMIGRALRGTKSQKDNKKKNTANIVFFNDNWKRIINFAHPESGGLSEETKVRGVYPIEFISLKLVEELSRKMDSGMVIAERPFLTYLPIGWYETEITVGMEDELATFKEFVIVTDDLKPKFEKFIKEFLSKPDENWEDEILTDEFMKPYLEKWIDMYFNENDNFKKTLDLDLIKLARHIAQSDSEPKFILFSERDKHDLSRIAFEVVNKKMSDFDIDDLLFKEYNSSEKLWREFYKDYYRFKTTFNSERERALSIRRHGSTVEFKLEKPELIKVMREASEEDKEKIFKHDNYTCQCCGLTINPKNKKERAFLITDHISAYTFSGDSNNTNLQTLCIKCNEYKKINEINFRITSTKLLSPTEFDFFCLDDFDRIKIENVLKRMINFFYFCKAVLNINYSTDGRGKYFRKWEIELYQGNNPEWLEKNKSKLLNYIRKDLKFENLEEIIIK